MGAGSTMDFMVSLGNRPPNSNRFLVRVGAASIASPPAAFGILGGASAFLAKRFLAKGYF